jgi:CHAT domain-containing protein
VRRRALGLGNPDLGSPRLALPAAEREVERLRHIFSEAEVSVGSAATKLAFVRRAASNDVADGATASLMARFYERLGRDGVRGALRHAQRELLADDRTRHPYSWAAFNVIGDWR